MARARSRGWGGSSMAPKTASVTANRARNGGGSCTNGGDGAKANGHGNGSTRERSSRPDVDEAALNDLLRALRAASDGDFSVRLPPRHRNPLLADIAVAFNAVVDRNARA